MKVAKISPIKYFNTQDCQVGNGIAQWQKSSEALIQQVKANVQNKSGFSVFLDIMSDLFKSIIK